MSAATSLADRVAALRDEVLGPGEAGERAQPGGEVFDAVLAVLVRPRKARSRRGGRSASSDVDLALQDALGRRQPWGHSELRVLGDVRGLCQRILAAARRTLTDPVEEMDVVQAVAEVGSAAARILIKLALDRLSRERAMLLRKERDEERLTQALERQREELVRLERALASAKENPGNADR